MDYSGLAAAWQTHSSAADVVPSLGDGMVGIKDFLLLSDDWLSPGAEFSPADLNEDGSVNLEDCALLAQSWLMAGSSLSDIAPFEDDQMVNIKDLQAMSRGWLASLEPLVSTDFNSDQSIDNQDFRLFTDAWLNNWPRIDIAPLPWVTPPSITVTLPRLQSIFRKSRIPD